MVEIYDTTLRDGAQREGISLTVEEKLRIATLLDELGVHYIEGGWPGALPKDTEFFARAAKELDLEHATLVAFGSTRRAETEAADDPQLRALLDAETEVICVVGKSWDWANALEGYHGAVVVDPAPHLPQDFLDLAGTLQLGPYFKDAIHENAAGARVVTDAIWQALEEMVGPPAF